MSALSQLLKRIKRLIIKGDYQFTLKAETELEADGLLIDDALESILNATDIYKTVNSSHPVTGKKEKLYIIKSVTYDNVLIYAKGKLYEEGKDVQFYILISSKRSI
jgi:hypothetical protein